MTTTFTDVTEQRNALRVMAQARDAAERGNKAKTEFLTRMSHELRTPLNSIIGFAGMLRNETLGPIGGEAYRGFANSIAMSGETLLSQINAIIDVARLEAGTIRLTEALIDPAAILESEISTATPAATARNIGLSYYLAPDLPAMRADEHRLRQILGHLLDNALKFSGPGTQILVRAEIDPLEGMAIVSVRSPRSAVFQ
jgi:signal transduction histidine kinase